MITLAVVSISVHHERVGSVGAGPAKPTESARVETAPQIPTNSHPRDLEQEMIENENRRHSVPQEQVTTRAEGHDTSNVEHIEQGREGIGGHNGGGARQQFHIEV